MEVTICQENILNETKVELSNQHVSSIEHGGTRTFMAPLTLFNEAPKCKSIALLALKNAYL